MIVLDCGGMKDRGSELAVFCELLAAGLVNLQDLLGDDLCMFVPASVRGYWGNSVSYRKISLLDRLWLHCPKDLRIWHSTSRQTLYIPPRGVRHLLTVHELDFLYEKPIKDHGRYLSALQKLVNRADYIVAVSEATKRDLVDNIDLKGRPLEIIPNGLTKFHESQPMSQSDSPEIEKMKTHAQNFSWERTARRYIKIYNELL